MSWFVTYFMMLLALHIFFKAKNDHARDVVVLSNRTVDYRSMRNRIGFQFFHRMNISRVFNKICRKNNRSVTEGQARQDRWVISPSLAGCPSMFRVLRPYRR